MNREKASRVAEMYKNAAKVEKDQHKAVIYYKKAANYYLKLGEVEDTIKCLVKLNLIESSLNTILQKLDTEKVIQYFESNFQVRLSLLSSAIAIENKLIDLKKLQESIEYYFNFNNIINFKLATNKEKIDVLSAVLLFQIWYSVEINASYELYFLDILANERKANYLNKNLLIVELLLILNDSLKYNNKNGNKLNEISDILIYNQMYPLQDQILRILIPVLIIQNKDISLLINFSENTKIQDYIIKLSGLLNNYNFEEGIKFITQNQKNLLANFSAEKKITSFTDIIWRLINSPIYNPENLLVNILKDKADKLTINSQELKDLYDLTFKIDDPAKLLDQLEVIFEHPYVNIYSSDIIQEILEKICLLAYDQEKFEKYDNYSSILENLYGIDINLVLKEIIQIVDE